MDHENNYYSDFSFSDMPTQYFQANESYALPSFNNNSLSTYDTGSYAIPDMTMYGNQGGSSVQLFDANTIKGADRTYQQQYGNTGRAFYDQTPEGYQQKMDMDLAAFRDKASDEWANKRYDELVYKPDRDRLARMAAESAADDAWKRQQWASVNQATASGNRSTGGSSGRSNTAPPQQSQVTKSSDYYQKRQNLLNDYYNNLSTPTMSKITGKDIYANMDMTPLYQTRNTATSQLAKTSALPVSVQRLLRRSLLSAMGEGMGKAWSSAYNAGANLATQNKNIEYQNAMAAASKNNALRSALSQDRLDALDYGIYEY